LLHAGALALLAAALSASPLGLSRSIAQQESRPAFVIVERTERRKVSNHRNRRPAGPKIAIGLAGRLGRQAVASASLAVEAALAFDIACVSFGGAGPSGPPVWTQRRGNPDAPAPERIFPVGCPVRGARGVFTISKRRQADAK